MAVVMRSPIASVVSCLCLSVSLSIARFAIEHQAVVVSEYFLPRKW